MGGILVGQLEKPHTTAVGLLFYTLGGKDCVYYLTGTGTDPLRPFANVKHFFTLLGKMFFTPYGKEFFTYLGKQIFTS